jgi:two-component system LytT family response regulator
MASRILIVEDEKRTRELLVNMIHSFQLDVELFEASTVVGATKMIKDLHPSIVVLDINLPDGTGFDVLDFAGDKDFKIIFSTAHEEFAIRAIKSAAFDYLLKPIDPMELKESISKALLAPTKVDQHHVEVLRENFNAKVPSKLVLNTSDSVFVIHTEDLIRCESEKNYTTFYISDGRKIITSKTMKDYESLLNDLPFYRCHRSHIINLNFFDRFDKREGGAIIMKNNNQIPLSRVNRDEFFTLLEQL